MKKHCIIVLLYLLGSFIDPANVIAQSTPKDASVKVTGEVTTPLDIKAADLKQFEQIKVTRKDKDGNDHVYTGIALSAILQKAGVNMGKDLRGKNLTKYILVEASDGYHVVFALAELDKDFTDRSIILTDEMDGKPLPAADGPYRIIVQDEKKPARCIRQVTGIKVESAQ